MWSLLSPLLSAIALAVHTPTEGHSITHLNRDVESIVPLMSAIALAVRTPTEGHSIALSNTKRYRGFAHSTLNLYKTTMPDLHRPGTVEFIMNCLCIYLSFIVE